MQPNSFVPFLALLLAMSLLAAGCAQTTGRTAGEWIDDKTTTARVKTALGASKVDSITRIDVDTVDGVVHLKGVVDSADARQQAEQIARNAASGRRVVNQLTVAAPAGSTPAPASAPASGTTSR